MNNDNLNENLTPEVPEENISAEAIPAGETVPETAPETAPEAAPEVNSEAIPEESIEAPKEIQETPSQPQQAPEIPQKPPYPYGQPAPQPAPQYGYNPYYQQAYSQPQYAQPYPQYPQYQPVKAKTKMKAGTVVLIVSMCILTVLGFGAFGLSLALYSGNTAEPETQQKPDGLYNYEDFYGDFFEDYGQYDPTEENSDYDSYTIKEPEQPDIRIPEVTEGIIINSEPSTPELSAEEVYAKVIPSTVTVDVDIYYTDGTQEDSTGTGIFISEDGFCITNSHVVSNSKSVSVKVITSDGAEYPAVVVGLDKTTDLAVLKVDGAGFTPAEFGSSDELSIGQWVIAIGNPGGTGFTGSLTRGVISGLDRKVGSYSANGMTYLQTDAAINPGNSGGPLVNMHGQVIGINSAKIVADYYEGMGFAIPSSKAKDIIDQLLTKGYVQGRVRLGITGQNVLYGQPEGVKIIAIDEYSSFAGTEAKVGDVIIGVNDTPIKGLTDLSNEFLKYAPGDTVKVDLFRASTGEDITIEVVLLEDKGETQR